MKTDLYVYISGPMTAKNGRSIEANLAEGVDLFITLIKLGIPAFCPHLNGLAPSAWMAGIPHESWVELDKVVIDRCTHVLMMPRWRESSGAVLEHNYAAELGLPIAYSLAELDAMLTAEAAAAPTIGNLLRAVLAAEVPRPRMTLAEDFPLTNAPVHAASASVLPSEPETPAVLPPAPPRNPAS